MNLRPRTKEEEELYVVPFHHQIALTQYSAKELYSSQIRRALHGVEMERWERWDCI
jgi:hypothetical protein